MKPVAKRSHRASVAGTGRAAPVRKRRGRSLLVLAGILAVTAIVYVPSLGNGFTNWDDPYYVTQNPLVIHPGFREVLTTEVAGNYHPLTIWSLALNYSISGLDPKSYHLVSLLLHLANTALVFFLVRLLAGRRLWVSAVTALFFGIHPMHVESVAWIAERKDVLYTFFYLLALIGYVRYLDSRRIAWLGFSLLSFMLSIASKPAAVVLPLSLLAIDWLRHRRFSARMLLEKAPFAAVSVAMGVLTLSAQKSVGALGQWNLFQKILFAAYGSVLYVVKLVAPFRLSAVYPYPLRDRIGAEYYAAFVALIVILPVTVWLFRRTRPVLFGIAFYFINIVLVLQLISVGNAVMADRYTYLPYVGLLFALAWWIEDRTHRVARGVVLALFLVLLPICLVQTWTRCTVWRDSGTLWNDVISKYPGRVFDAYLNRGYELLDQGKRIEALADFEQAIAINPKVARAWINKGDVMAEMGQNDSAYVCFDRAIALKPDSPEALSNRGGIKFRRGDVKGAISDFSQAIGWNPSFRDAYSNRALAYAALHDYQRAISDRSRAIDLEPRNPLNYLQYGSLATALAALGRYRDAIQALDRAIAEAPPDDARLGGYYLRRSEAWKALGDGARAASDAQEAMRRGATWVPRLRDHEGPHFRPLNDLPCRVRR